jgi:hypothetical protein
VGLTRSHLSFLDLQLTHANGSQAGSEAELAPVSCADPEAAPAAAGSTIWPSGEVDILPTEDTDEGTDSSDWTNAGISVFRSPIPFAEFWGLRRCHKREHAQLALTRTSMRHLDKSACDRSINRQEKSPRQTDTEKPPYCIIIEQEIPADSLS